MNDASYGDENGSWHTARTHIGIVSFLDRNVVVAWNESNLTWLARKSRMFIFGREESGETA